MDSEDREQAVRLFGDMLREYRRAAGLTQEALAEAAGLSARAVSDLERGLHQAPQRGTVRQLAQALGLSRSEYVTFEHAAGRGPALLWPRGAPASSAEVGPAPRSVALGGGVPPRAAPHNLPVQVTSFVGREREQSDVACLVVEAPTGARLLTLTGPGGMGKTRLALEVAATLLDAFPDGVYVVALAPIRDPDLVAAAIGQALKVKETGGEIPEQRLTTYLRDKKLLLLLDNFEHVLTAAPLVSRLLQACPYLTVLVTSRAVLHIYGEQEYLVPPLAVPAGHGLAIGDAPSVMRFAAVALFIQRAQLAAPSFTVTDQTARAVAEICLRLDGLPLAIELAAARSKLLAPQALLARLHSRLALLTGGGQDLPARLQTLRGAIDWSYDLLDDEEKALFAGLSVFVGGFTAEAVEMVCAVDDVLDGLTSLVDKSLLQHQESASGEHRFTMLELIREYAAEQLGAAPHDAAIIRQRSHALFYLTLAEEAAAAGGWVSPWGWLVALPAGHGAWQVRLTNEQDNLRAALRWAQEHGDLDLGPRLVGALGWFWYVEGHWSEGRTWFQVFHTLEQTSVGTGGAPATTAPLTRYLDAAGFALMQGDDQRAHSLLRENLALLRRRGDRRGMAIVLGCLGLVDDAADRAAAFHEESLALCRELGDGEGQAIQLTWLAARLFEQGDIDRGLALQEEACVVARAQAEKRILVNILGSQGHLLARHGDVRAARALLEEDVALARALDDQSALVAALEHCAAAARAQGEYARAQALLEEELVVLQGPTSHKQHLHEALLALGLTARDAGDLAGAMAHTAECLRLAGLVDDVEIRRLALENLALIAWEQGDLVKAETLCSEALALGRTVRTQVGESVSGVLATMGLIAQCQGDLERAQTCLTRGLQRARAVNSRQNALACLDRLASLAAAQGSHVHAVQLFGATDALRTAVGAVLPPVLRALNESALAAARAALGNDTFAAAWTDGQTMTLDQAAARALHAVCQTLSS